MTGGREHATLVCVKKGSGLLWEPTPGETLAHSGGSSSIKSGGSSDGSSGAEAGKCSVDGGPEIAPAVTKFSGTLTAAYTDASKIAYITPGLGDPRFVYAQIASAGSSVNIYAPAPGVLYLISHKTPEFGAANDYDLIFFVDCNTIFRINHVTDPRPDIKAAYPAGNLPSIGYTTGQKGTGFIIKRMIPTKRIVVRAGDLIGTTTGTPLAHNFDFGLFIKFLSVCPFNHYAEPYKTTFMNLLGPANGPATPGYACTIPPAAP